MLKRRLRWNYSDEPPKKDLGGIPATVYAARLGSLANPNAKESSTVCTEWLYIRLLLKQRSRCFFSKKLSAKTLIFYSG